MLKGPGSHQGILMHVAFAAAAAGLMLAPASAQVRTVDPNTAIDADLVPGAPASANATPGTPPAAQTDVAPPPPPPPADPATAPSPAAPAPVNTTALCTGTGTPQPNGATYKQDDLIGAAEGVFGKGAKGLADIIEKTLKEQGEPVAYISGREASAAIGVGLRYGSGTMCHKIEGQRDVYWTGPSLGFDLGGNAGKTFVLVYNLYDSQDLYHRYPAGEGAAYFVGGFNASYLRWGKVVLIPIRVGVGVRLGANIGYMKFSEKRRLIPF
ncbi:MAG: DUF1134 domain-containing protein [Sphingobium sp.]|nr:DUF1134 domain-containing protein [Sphingobium sp.]